MFAKIKNFVILIPCMIFGLFLCSNVEAKAIELTMSNSTVAVVGDETVQENKYYFTNSTSWSLLVKDYDGYFDGDTLLKYRVIKGDGTATDWSDYINFLNTKGKFNIDMSKLSFTETEDLSARNSVSMTTTYFVDVKYYTRFKLMGVVPIFTKDQNKDETIKVIYNDNSNSEVYIPKVDVSYNSANNHYAVTGKVADQDDNAVSVITEIKYFYTSEKLSSLDFNEFDKGYKESSEYGVVDFEMDYQATATIDRVDGEDYLYILVKSGNGYVCIKEVDNKAKTVEDTGDNDKNPLTGDENDDDTGLFDFEFGEFILLVLIIVLVVSCALIITQKIVDYKKRLY